MGKTKPIRAIDMVRRIRDELARELAGKSEAEIIAFYNRAGEAARTAGKKRISIGQRKPARSKANQSFSS